MQNKLNEPTEEPLFGNVEGLNPAVFRYIVKTFTFISNHSANKEILPMDGTSTSQTVDILGSVMVIGGGIAGMQASLDLADSGYKV